MFTSKGKGLPIIITIMLIVIIIYLFATVEQPLVVCEKKVTDDLDITVSEVLETTLDGKEIEKMVLVKTIILPDKYLVDDNELDSIMFSLEKSTQVLCPFKNIFAIELLNSLYYTEQSIHLT